MKKTLSVWQIGGFVFTAILGVILHFLFDWTNKSLLVAPFSAVNESIWEHMKLVFFPMLLFTFVESGYMGKDYKNFWCAKLIGIVLGTVFIPVLYYTINGALGPAPDWVNIVIFVICVAAGYFMENKILQNGNLTCKSPALAILVLIAIAVIFVIFTFFTPEINIFKDPVTNTYGIGVMK